MAIKKTVVFMATMVSGRDVQGEPGAACPGALAVVCEMRQMLAGC